jgi:hypothetical protein
MSKISTIIPIKWILYILFRFFLYISISFNFTMLTYVYNNYKFTSLQSKTRENLCFHLLVEFNINNVQ